MKKMGKINKKTKIAIKIWQNKQNGEKCDKIERKKA